MHDSHLVTSVPLSDEQSPSFNVVIAYEDFETGKNAKRTFDFLVENLGTDCQFENQMWKFDVLKIPKLQSIAVADAANADMLIISCRGGHELPAHVTNWIEACLAEGCPAMALVALFDCDPEDSYGIRTYLADVAARGNMELFAQPDEWPGNALQLRPRTADALRLQPATAVRRWQIRN